MQIDFKFQNPKKKISTKMKIQTKIYKDLIKRN